MLGERFAAGEIGHVVVDPRGDECACGLRGCLETVIAAPLLRRHLAEADKPGRVRTNAGRRLGVALAPVVSTLNLREVVLSGPPELLDDAFRSAALDTVRDRTLPAVGDNVEVRLDLARGGRRPPRRGPAGARPGTRRVLSPAGRRLPSAGGAGPAGSARRRHG